MTDAEKYWEYIKPILMRREYPGSQKDIAAVLGMTSDEHNNARRECKNAQPFDYKLVKHDNYSKLEYWLTDDSGKPATPSGWEVDGILYVAVEEINNGNLLSYTELMERERRVAEVDKASRNLTAGKASSKDRKVLIEWGIDPERVAEVHLNAIEKRGNPPTQAYQEAIRRISGSMGGM